MKRTLSLRTQFIALMALLVFLQSFALASALYISRVFFMLDAEAFRLFDSATDTRVQSYNTAVGGLIGSAAEEASALNDALNALAASGGIDAGQMYLDNDLYLEACILGADTLFSLMRKNVVSGAFFIVQGSNASKGDDTAYSSVHIHNSSPNTNDDKIENYQLELGTIAISTHYGIATSVNWDLELIMPARLEDTSNLYKNPILAAMEQQGEGTESFGYWASSQSSVISGQEAVSYTLPLLDAAGQPYGVVGFEISLPLFTQYYLPNVDLPYQNSFYAIAKATDEQIYLDWVIPSGPLASVYLNRLDSLELSEVEGGDLYQTSLEGLGDMYCAVKPLKIYGQNSPFYDESWSLISMVPEHVLHDTSSGVRTLLIISIAATTLITLVVVVIIVLATTRKISGLSKYVRGLSPHMDISFSPTGIKEIDDLTSAVEMLNKSLVNSAKTTSKILELTLLPIGGYEISSDSKTAVLTEYLYTLLDIEPGRQLTIAEWESIYAGIIAKPAPGYDDIYRYEKDKDDIRWLRVQETTTETGRVGVILDASKDIEENRRLAHELDYDALTRLLNRTAFKRDAHAIIQRDPDSVGAMIFADLDNLKYMNDTFGHDIGDRLIIRAGEMFRTFESYGAIVSRISGDEFAIYLHGYSDKEELKKIILDHFAKVSTAHLSTPDGKEQRIRCSSGIAFYPQDSDNATDLLKLADFAMYEAKHNSKGSVYEFSPESYKSKAYLLENREAINRLIDEGLTRFAFQPIVSIKTGQVYAYEALMRPLLDNFKSPLEILAVADAQSKLAQLERMIIFKAFDFLRDNQATLGEAKLFVNSISSHVLGPEDQAALEEKYSAVFDKMVVEITEDESDSPREFANKMEFIKRNRINVAIDDYGSGYSNEIRVLSMEPDIIKVDIQLISGIDTNVDKQHLVSNLLSFCKPKGIKVVAEGVETPEELAAVIGLGVDYVQGYYIMKPQPEPAEIPRDISNEILRLQGGAE